MSERYVLRDIDNRDDNMDPWETSAATLTEFVGYVDGPLRGDLTSTADFGLLDAAIDALRAEDFTMAEAKLREFGVYLRREDGEKDG